MIERGWNVATMLALADELSVSTRTVRREWSRAMRLAPDALNPELMEDLVFDQLMRLDDTIRGAIAGGCYRDAIRGELLLGLLVGTLTPAQIAEIRRC